MKSPLLSRKSGIPQKLSLLVVEPHNGRRGEISNLLSDLGVQADSVPDEGHASQLLEKKNYHAILADGLMPGFHFLQLIAAKFTMDRDVPMPVVAAVVEKDRTVRSRWEDNDFDEQLEWPICPSQLRRFLDNCQLHHQTL